MVASVPKTDQRIVASVPKTGQHMAASVPQKRSTGGSVST